MSEADDPAGLPPILAAQVELIRSQFDQAGAAPAEDLLRYVDAAVLNICEHAETSMPLLNRVMGLRAAAEGLSQVLEAGPEGEDDRQAALVRAHAELAALEEALAVARPSAIIVALGLGW